MQALWVVPAVLALVDWYAVGRGDRRTETWAKPATLLALILVALVLGGTGTPAGLWLLVALVLGLVGDVSLLGRTESRFRLGLAAFLVGHLAYVVSFTRIGLDPAGWAWVAWPVLFGCLLATRHVVPATFLRGGQALALPVAAYTVVIGAMVILAFDTGEARIATGAAVFAVSDSILAVDRFVAPRPWAPVAVMVTYHVGQALIVAGVLAAT
ncbi:MAG TPA: lysoplasmalogenase [Nocardioides sp.]|uniref:lysoplasmalogenase n=1 Tax=Nocardioides sp. TaxID=35761 RepID=UPI002F3E2595